MKKLLFLSLILAMGGISACKKAALSPSLSGGECEIKATGYKLQSQAKSEMDRIIGILRNYTVGDATLAVIRDQTYVSETKKNNASAYGYQIVFSCGDAAIHTEYEEFNSYVSMDFALSNRLDVLNHSTNLKVIGQDTGSFDYGCYTWPDVNGNYVAYCDTGYNYTINYVDVLHSGLMPAVIDVYDLYKSGRDALGLKTKAEDTITFAKRLAAAGSSDEKALDDWKGLLNQIQRKQALFGKSVPKSEVR